MKKVGIVLGIIVAAILFIISCDKLQSDHPQAELNNQAKLQNETEIKAYADSVNGLLPVLKKQESLVYTLGDHTFSVTKYTDQESPVLYIEKSSTGYGGTEKRYYLKKDQLLLYSVLSESYNIARPYTLKNEYFRNNILFYAEEKRTENKNELKTVPFTPISNPAPAQKDHIKDLSSLEDALKQRDQFNLVFDGITEYPKAKYIILTRNELNAYRAAIRVDKEDDLVRELSSNPARYKGARLDLQWKIAGENEAVYQSGRIK